MDRKAFYAFGGVLCLIAAAFLALALTHPEWSFPWPNWVSYTMYALYGIYTVLIFCMPRFEGANLASCFILAVQFIALAFIVLSIGIRGTAGESNWYLPIGLGLTCAANFATAAMQKKRGKAD